MGESLILSIFFSFKLCYMHLPKTEVWNLSFKVEENISFHVANEAFDSLAAICQASSQNKHIGVY